MKILWLSHLVPYPPKGGVLQRSYHLLKELSKSHQVDLLAFNQTSLMKPLVSSIDVGLAEAKLHLSKFCGKVEFFDIISDGTVWSRKWLTLKSLFTNYPYTLNWLLSDEFHQRVETLVKREGYDYVHFDTISLAPFLSACKGVKTSLDHHNVESHMLIRRACKESNPLKRFYFYQEGKRLERYEKYFCPRFDLNFTCSELDTERLQAITPESRIHTIPNGVDIEFFKPSGNPERTNSILFIGTMNWYPNIEAVQFLGEQVWPELKLRLPDIAADIIGANPPEPIKRFSVEDPRFHVHGFVDDIHPLLDSAMCYVCPIKDGGGTKLKILDALAMGKAIVADPIACEGIDVEDGINVLFAETKEEYLECIDRVFSEPELRMKLEKNARILAVEKYSYERIGRQLSSLFSGLGSQEVG